MVPSSVVKWDVLTVSKMVALLEDMRVGKMDENWGSQMAGRWGFLMDGEMGHRMATTKAAMLAYELEMYWVAKLDNLSAGMLDVMTEAWTGNKWEFGWAASKVKKLVVLKAVKMDDGWVVILVVLKVGGWVGCSVSLMADLKGGVWACGKVATWDARSEIALAEK